MSKTFGECLFRLSKRYNRFFYNKFFYSRMLSGDMQFFNAGLDPVDSEIADGCRFKGEERQAQVYYETVKAYKLFRPELQPVRVLEIASGLGGGQRVLSRFFPESSIIGLDYSETAAKRAGRVSPGSLFVVADALKPPFKDSGFDLIVNVESLHSFSDMGCFFKEMSRMMSQRGCLVLMDFRLGPAADVASRMYEPTLTAGLKMEVFHDMTPRLVASVRADVTRQERLIKKVPGLLKSMAHEMLVTENSKRFQQYCAGDRTYFLALFSKQPV